MVEIDTEKHAQIVAMLKGDAPESEETEEVEAQSVEEESDASEGVEEDLSDEDEDTDVEAASDDPEEDIEEGHRVPYDRFKQINDRRHELQEELKARDGQLEELKDRLRAQTEVQTVPDDQYLFDEYEEDIEVADPTAFAAQLKVMEESNKRLEVKFATIELEKEISSVREEFPDVPEEFLWETIAQDGTVSARDAASRYSEFVGEIEEAAVAKYLREQGEGDPGSAPPRPQSKQTATSFNEDPPAPADMDEARMAMLEYLRS